jgi:peptidoglycan hydrolase-like protein with peptidoglycan-binding domain
MTDTPETTEDLDAKALKAATENLPGLLPDDSEVPPSNASVLQEEGVKTPARVARKGKSQAKPYAVVGNGETDEVLLSRAVYQSKRTRKSLTVHHLQRRLTELGYQTAGADIDGFLGDLTKRAVAKFQADSGLPETGDVDAETFERIFEGDPNVTVKLDV